MEIETQNEIFDLLMENSSSAVARKVDRQIE